MKKKNSYIICGVAILFLVAINTVSLWEVYIGGLSILIFFSFIPIFLVLTVLLFAQLVFLLKKEHRNRYRILATCTLAIVLCLILWKPFGVVNYEQLQGYDYLTAKTGGVKDTFDPYITLSLSRDGKYVQSYAVFGRSEVRGTYTVQGDTIFFNRTTSYNDDEDYQFAVIEDYRIGNNQTDPTRKQLILHKSHSSKHEHMMHPKGDMLEDMGWK